MNTFADVVNLFIGFIDLLIPLLFALIFLVIAWRTIDAWVLHGGDQKKVDEGKQTLVVGVIVLVVLSGLWGIVRLLQSSIFG
jgi:hypothetical protein